MSGNSWKIAVCSVALSLFAAAPAPLGAETKPRTSIDKNQPLQVDADRLDACNDKRTVVFSGNVVASQGARTVRSESLTIYYRDDKKSHGKSALSGQETGNVEKIEANGKVVVTEGNRVATGDFAVFEQDSQKITMTGNAVLKEGENVIRGNRIVIFLEENRGIVESGEKGRVSATIYPGDKK